MEKMTKEMKYVKAEAKIINFSREDIIIASESGCGDQSSGYNEGWKYCQRPDLSQCEGLLWKLGFQWYKVLSGECKFLK